MTIEFLPLGPDGVLMRLATRTSPEASAAVRALLARVEAAAPDGVTEVAGGLGSVLVRFDPGAVSRGALVARLRDLPQAEGAAMARRLWRIPAAFGGAAGPQFGEAAELAGLGEAEALRDLTETTLDILTIGFAPGQPYLGHLPPAWDIPRQSGLTPKVPAGAVVVALRQVIPFTGASTTGWRQVGRTAFRPFLRGRAEPFALRPGDRLRFEAVPEAEVARREADADGLGGAVVEELA